MNRRQFLGTLLSAGKKEVSNIPSSVAKIPKKTVTNLMEYDKLVKDIGKQNNNPISKRTLLGKMKRRMGRLMIKNPSETAYRANQLGKGYLGAMGNAITPLDDLALKAEGRKLSKLGSLLSNFRRY